MSVRPRCAPIWRPGCWGAAGAAAGRGFRHAGGPAAGIRPVLGHHSLCGGGSGRVQPPCDVGADQRQFAGAVRRAGAAGRGRQSRLYPAGAGRDRAGRPDAVAGGRAAVGFAGAFHFAVGAVRLHQRRGGADRRACAEGCAGPARPGFAWRGLVAAQAGLACRPGAGRFHHRDAGDAGRGAAGAPVGQAQALYAGRPGRRHDGGGGLECVGRRRRAGAGRHRPAPGRRSTCPAWTGARCPTCSAWPSR